MISLARKLVAGSGLWGFLALALALWGGYEWAYHMGQEAARSELTPQIINLKSRVQTLEGMLSSERDQRVAEMERVQKIATDQLIELQDRLRASRAQAQKLERLQNEVPVYVTKAADAACVVPVGFVQLHNAYASGEAPTTDSGAEGRDAPGPQGDADAPSGLALSTVSSVVTENYLNCRKDQDRLRLWQDWYLHWRERLPPLTN